MKISTRYFKELAEQAFATGVKRQCVQGGG